jgi:hypothetical protein
VSQDEGSDPDRAAILARRRRFIALAISGLSTGGCKHEPPRPCLSIAVPNEDADAGVGEDEDAGEPSGAGPFVEDPGAPVEGETGEASEPNGPGPETTPHPCLKMRPPPQPCLMVYRK